MGMTTEPTGNTQAHYRQETIDLPDGFKATVLTGGELICRIDGSPATLPSAGEWREPLTKLITNPDTLPECEVLKHSNTTQVLRSRLTFQSGVVDVICKRTIASRTLDRWACRLAGSRARRRCDTGP